MTLLSLRKLRTTVRGRIIPARTQGSLAVAFTLLLASLAPGQQPNFSTYNVQPTPSPLPASLALPATPLPLPAPSSGLPVVSSSVPVQAQWAAPGKNPPSIRLTGGPTIRRTAFQMPKPGPNTEDGRVEYQVDIVPPGLQRLARLDSDTKLQQRIRQETLERTANDPVVFPDEPILSRDAYMGRAGLWATRQMTVEPYFVNYRQLYFQQLNTERYGWDLGPITPLVCLGAFFYDVGTFPMHVATRPCERDSSTGYCLPGDPVPLLLYPPDITVQGVTLETAVVIALIAIFP